MPSFFGRSKMGFHKQSFIKGAAILAAAGIISKALGAI